jgi:hypothetical protein
LKQAIRGPYLNPSRHFVEPRDRYGWQARESVDMGQAAEDAIRQATKRFERHWAAIAEKHGIALCGYNRASPAGEEPKGGGKS